MHFVKWTEVYGSCFKRLDDPESIKAALGGTVESNRPILTEIMVPSDIDASLEPNLDKIVEYEPLPVYSNTLAKT